MQMYIIFHEFCHFKVSEKNGKRQFFNLLPFPLHCCLLILFVKTWSVDTWSDSREVETWKGVSNSCVKCYSVMTFNSSLTLPTMTNSEKCNRRYWFQLTWAQNWKCLRWATVITWCPLSIQPCVFHPVVNNLFTQLFIPNCWAKFDKACQGSLKLNQNCSSFC